MPGPTYHTAGEEPIYHAVCAWADQQRRTPTRGRAWPTEEPDTAEQHDPERTVRLLWPPEHMFGPWEVHERHLRMRRAEPPI